MFFCLLYAPSPAPANLAPRRAYAGLPADYSLQQGANDLKWAIGEGIENLPLKQLSRVTV